MALYYASGWGYNLLSRGTVTASPGSDSLFPLANLYAGDSTQRWKASSLAADSYIQLDSDVLIVGDFEGTHYDAWTDASTGDGAIAEETTTVHTGSSALKLDANTGTAGAYYDVTVRAGERLKLSGWINPSAGLTGSVRVQNLSTGNYLVSDAWQAAAGDAISVTDEADYTEDTSTFQVESLSTCLRSTVTLRVTCYTEDDGDILFDDINFWPAINFVSIHGHALHPVLDVTLRSSTDAFVGVDTEEATVTLAIPTCYAYLSTAVYRPDWRLYLGGTNAEIPWLGEVVMGYVETIGQPQRYDWIDTRKINTVTQEMWSGRIQRYRLSDYDRGAVRMSWTFQDSDALTDFTEWKAGLFLRSKGDIPTLIVPYSGDSQAVLGYLMTDADISRHLVAGWKTDLAIDEIGFPVVGA